MGPKEKLDFYQSTINEYLDCIIPKGAVYHDRLYDAMHYSLTAGGKRIRPILCMEFCRVFNKSAALALDFASALEMIHTYSLIHDDLPCMDDDDLRRGIPANHKVFGEATAVLAGDALLTLALETALKSAAKIEPGRVIAALDVLLKAAGPDGMIGGQIIDLDCEGKDTPIEKLNRLHKMKTGELIKASVQTGCILAGANDDAYAAATKYSEKIGLAFQIKDDILDVEGDALKLGKSTGRDKLCKKSTYVTHFGLDNAKSELKKLTAEAKECILDLNDNEFLLYLTDFLLTREN